jgi:hypothetical protein
LETKEIIVRGEVRAVIPFAEIRAVRAEGGALHLAWGERAVVLEIGKVAERWAKAIQNPKSRIQKLGVKPGMAVLVVDVDDAAFGAELDGAGAKRVARAKGDADLVFWQPASVTALARIARVREAMRSDGALWVLRVKGGAVGEHDVLQAGRGAGLVDTKVVAFSETLSAAKFMVPLAKRKPSRAVR